MAVPRCRTSNGDAPARIERFSSTLRPFLLPSVVLCSRNVRGGDYTRDRERSAR